MTYLHGSARLGWVRWLQESGWYTDERVRKEMEDFVSWYFRDKDRERGREKKQERQSDSTGGSGLGSGSEVSSGQDRWSD